MTIKKTTFMEYDLRKYFAQRRLISDSVQTSDRVD